MVECFILAPVCPLFTSIFHRHGRTRPSYCADSVSCQQNETGMFAPEALTQQKVGPTTGRIEPQPATTKFGRHVAQPQYQRHRIANQLALLIDDVMTTGATLYEAAKPLIGRGAARFAGWSWRVFYATGCTSFMQC